MQLISIIVDIPYKPNFVIESFTSFTAFLLITFKSFRKIKVTFAWMIHERALII